MFSGKDVRVRAEQEEQPDLVRDREQASGDERLPQGSCGQHLQGSPQHQEGRHRRQSSQNSYR